MEAKRSLIIAAILFALSLAQGCSTSRKGEAPIAEEASQSQASEAFGPPEPRNEPAYGPEPVQLRPVVLVLGPGMARGFTHVGALQAMKEARIPVGAVLGCEMGSLIAALYAAEENLNHLEWALMRFKDDVFVGGGISKLFNSPGNGNKLESELSRTFGAKDISDSRIPLRIMIQPKGSPDPLILERGEIAKALRAALAQPELIAPGSWEGGDAVAAQSVVPWLLREARALGTGPVVLIDSSGAEELGPDADADLIIRPALRGIDKLDFKKRTEAAFRGKTATKKSLVEIRKLVGLPQRGLNEVVQQ